MSKRLLDNTDVKKLAQLAQLTLSDEELEEYRKQLDESLRYVNNLNELSVEKLDKALNISRLENISRNDAADLNRTLSCKVAQKNSSHTKNNYFIVKRILT